MPDRVLAPGPGLILRVADPSILLRDG